MKQVTIIIPNYNGKKYLMRCLQTVFANTEIPVDVIVVDNHSQDGSIEEAMQYYPQVQYISLDKNYGFSKAVNEGIVRAATPYVLLLNQDTEIEPGVVEYLLRRIKTDRKIFSVEAKMIQLHDKTKIDSAGTFYNVFGWARARGKDKPASCTRSAVIYLQHVQVQRFTVKRFSEKSDCSMKRILHILRILISDTGHESADM